MLKRTVLVLTVLACVDVVYGAAVKHTCFDFNNEPNDPSVMAILNYTADASGEKTIIKIMMSDFTPMTSYDLLLREPGAECPCGLSDPTGVCLTFPLITDENGDLMFHLVFPNFDISSYGVELYVNVDEDDCLDPEELRAKSAICPD